MLEGELGRLESFRAGTFVGNLIVNVNTWAGRVSWRSSRSNANWSCGRGLGEGP